MSVLVGLLWALPHAASACSCIQPPPPLEALAAADAVFEARAVRQRVHDPAATVPRQDYEFQVLRRWKGEVDELVTITTASSSAACGRHYELGETYVIYAYAPESGGLHDGLCTRTRLRADADEDVAALGPGEAPAAAAPDQAPGDAREPPRIEPSPSPSEPSSSAPKGCGIAGDPADLALALPIVAALARTRRRRE